ncbi:membrane protein [Camelimonas fluminis]|uniref:Tim44 domain-containing protein n=1 Tax=Camelimonas fluminis TaxID=1576911 RepID=A0ABV7UH54_9HYPH|nr:Tim44 domain-containing protein [Camelimonas fluminis]GHE75109.1 membrane protein [Camelimonas fluminis]
MNQALRRSGLAALALVVAFGMTIGAADARKGGGGGFGSRGSKTWSAPPSTQTAPSTAAPMQRTQTQPGMQSGAAGMASQAAQPRRFGGFGAGLMGGLLGAGLIGMLMGGGFFSGMAGLAGFMGLLLQVALVGGLVWLAVRYFRSRQAATAGPQPGASNYTAAPSQSGPRPGLGASGFGGAGGAMGAMGGGSAASRQPQYAPATAAAGSDGVGLGQQDYENFERLLAEMQTAYGRGDVGALRRICTPEAAAYLEEELAENERRGVVNTASDVKLVQGDLAEAWREGATDYATVAMRYSMIDVTRERASGRVVDGDPSRPTEVTEVWTFRRDNRGPWTLSAIQDVN